MYSKMKIIIEGLDNVGKSTLINNIIKNYKCNFLYLHYYATPNKDSPIEWGSEQYHTMFKIFDDFDFVIADRAHLGELVYPKMYGGYDGSYVQGIEQLYDTDDIFLITLVDEPENLIARDDGLSLSIDKHKKQQEKELFVKAHEQSSIKNKMLVNVKGYDEIALKNKVFNFIEKMEIWK